MTRRVLPLLALTVSCLLLCACAQRDPVQQLIDDAVAAAEDRDGDALAELLASDFTAGDGSDRAAAVTYAKQMLFAYRALDLSLSDVQINRRGDSARATFRLKLTGVPSNFGGIGDLVPRQASYEFEISARVESGDWKFVTASWKEGPSS